MVEELENIVQSEAQHIHITPPMTSLYLLVDKLSRFVHRTIGNRLTAKMIQIEPVLGR